MVRVEVINGTGEEIVIKEGNAGIYREVQRIRKGGSHTVSVDENATYREFMCVETKSGLTVTLTSDDCIDYSEVRIKYDENKTKLYFESTPRKTRGIIDATTDSNIGKSVKGASSWFTGLFKKK
ncbi:hypothetical protein KC19_4G235300 [Ceratodon purpureus]|uniref:DUF7748 domain-containing protein n=1 Tax=Ceratodon purpureus TaxID=3225 RepID=A0A8T0IBY0_CERPU|nr:hypothetical protein KC19_4G235300 [Ceratodon purpureus]